MKLAITCAAVVLLLCQPAIAVTLLKQSTAAEIPLGAFVDETDGFTAETGLTISQADVRLKKNDSDWAQKNETTAAVHEEFGQYRILLNATDTNTLGRLRVAVHESGARPVSQDFLVVADRVYDGLVSGSLPLPVDVTYTLGSPANAATLPVDVDVQELNGVAAAADNLALAFAATGFGANIARLTVSSGGGTGDTGSCVVTGLNTAIASDAINGMTVVIRDSAALDNYVVGRVADFTTSTDTITYELVAAPGFTISAGDSIDLIVPAYSFWDRQKSFGRTGTAVSGGADYIEFDILAVNTAEYYRGWSVYIYDGEGAGQIGYIARYTSSRRAYVRTNWVVQPNSTSKYVLLPAQPIQ